RFKPWAMLRINVFIMVLTISCYNFYFFIGQVVKRFTYGERFRSEIPLCLIDYLSLSVKTISLTSASSRLNHSPLNLLSEYVECKAFSKLFAIFLFMNFLLANNSIVGFSLCNVNSLYFGLFEIPIL